MNGQTTASLVLGLIVLGAAAPSRAADPLDAGTEPNRPQREPRIDPWQLIEDGRYEEAEEAARRGIASRPNDDDPYNTLAATFYMRHDFKNTRLAEEKAIALAPWADVYRTNLAGVDVILGRLKEAQRLLQMALILNPDSWRAQRELALIYDCTGREAKATEMAKTATESRALVDASSGVTAYPELEMEDDGLAAEAAGNWDEAREAWTALDQIERDGLLHVECLRGRGAAHLAKLNRHIVEPPAPVAVAAVQVVEPVVEQVRVAPVQTPENPTLHFVLGLALMQQGRVSEAIASFQRALDIDPKHYLALMQLGKAHLIQRGLDRSRTAFTNAVAAASTDEQRALARVALAEVELTDRRLDQAEAQLNHALELAPEHSAAYYGLALLYDATGREAAVKTMLGYAVTSDHEGAWLLSEPFALRETQVAVAALAAESTNQSDSARTGWSQLRQIDAAGRLETGLLRGRAEAHLELLDRLKDSP